MGRRKPIEERFWEKVDATGDCWLWTGATNARGYGTFRGPAGHLMAHRYSWELAHGEPPAKDLQVCHRCDKPGCVRPAHLFLGTAKINQADATAKGRRRQTGYLREKKGRPGYFELVAEAPKDPVTKRRRQARRGFRGSRKDAETALRRLMDEVQSGQYKATEGSLGFLLEQWLDHVEGGLAATTLREYRRLIKKRILPALGHIPLRKLDAGQLDTFYMQLRRDGLSAASVRQIHAIIRRALHQALDWGWLDANPASRAGKSLKVHRQEVTPPTPAEALSLVDKASEVNPELGAYLRIKMGTGARRGEMCGLRRSDYDKAGHSLLIARSVAVVGRKKVIVKDTKTHQARRLSLGADTAKVIEEQIARMAIRAADGGVELLPNAFLFSAALDGSRPWNPDHVNAVYRTVREKLGLTSKMHDLRHFHATELGAKGVPVRTIAARLGHAQASTTLNMYSHALKASDEDAASIIDQVLDAKKRPAQPRRRKPRKDGAQG